MAFGDPAILRARVINGRHQPVLVLVNAEDDVVGDGVDIGKDVFDVGGTAPLRVFGDGSPGYDLFGRIREPIDRLLQVLSCDNMPVGNLRQAIRRPALWPAVLRA